MSAICGIITGEYAYRPKTSLLEKMCRALAHRGPDDEGIFVDVRAGLGARCLSLIDVRGGHQPVHDESRDIWLVLDGQIYNSVELRRLLEEGGHTFHSECDGEVAMHAYKQYGEDFLGKLRGAFALAVWDKKEKKLLLARDRIGIKPLYYATARNDLVFASEIKALLRHREVDRRINMGALDHFLGFGYVSGEGTIFEGVRRLLPGHILTFRDGSLSIRKYWDLGPPQREPPSRLPARLREMEYCAQLLDRIKDSVKMCLRNEVPLGVLLSDGICSSTVVALASEISDEPILTLSVCFDESSYEGLAYARVVARRFGTRHCEVALKPKPLELTLHLARFLDEPLADVSVFSSFMVSRVARERVKVVLAGEGGDQLFAGDDAYFADYLARSCGEVPSFLGQKAIPALMKIIPLSFQNGGVGDKIRRFMEGATLPPHLQHLRWRTVVSPAERDRLYTADARAALPKDAAQEIELLRRVRGDADRLAGQLYVDLKTYLADCVLARVDRMGMANSLEVGLPLLDHELVEFVAGIPSSFKLRGLCRQYILRRALKTTLPRANPRGPKQRPDVLIGNWLREELRPLLLETLSERGVEKRGLFSWPYVKRLTAQHLSGRWDNSRQLWALLLLELWLQAHSCRDQI